MKTKVTNKVTNESGRMTAIYPATNETVEEIRKRQRTYADEQYNLFHFGTKEKPPKPVKTTLPRFPKFSKSYSDTPSLTVQQEDIKYREQMREAMEDDDIFSYNW